MLMFSEFMGGFLEGVVDTVKAAGAVVSTLAAGKALLK